MAQDDKTIKTDEELLEEADKIKNDFVKKVDALMKKAEEIKIKNLKDNIK